MATAASMPVSIRGKKEKFQVLKPFGFLSLGTGMLRARMISAFISQLLRRAKLVNGIWIEMATINGMAATMIDVFARLAKRAIYPSLLIGTAQARIKSAYLDPVQGSGFSISMEMENGMDVK